MARPQQEAIDTFISITGADEAVAIRKLEVSPKSPPIPSSSCPVFWFRRPPNLAQSVGLARWIWVAPGMDCSVLGFSSLVWAGEGSARGGLRWPDLLANPCVAVLLVQLWNRITSAVSWLVFVLLLPSFTQSSMVFVRAQFGHITPSQIAVTTPDELFGGLLDGNVAWGFTNLKKTKT